MSPDGEPSEHDDPAKVMHDIGWYDGWENLTPRAPSSKVDERRVYFAAYDLAQAERRLVPAYHPDCDGTHSDGECPLRTVDWRERWLDRAARLVNALTRRSP